MGSTDKRENRNLVEKKKQAEKVFESPIVLPG